MNSQSTSNWPVLCYVNMLTQHGLYLSLSIIAKSNAAFCAKHETKGSCKMPCSPCLAIKCRLFRLPLIQNVVQHFLIVTSLRLCYSPSIWWHVPLGNDFDILILILMTFLLEKTQPHSMKAAIQHQPQIATFFLWELCTLDSHCFNKSLIIEVYIVATVSTSGNSL